MCVSSDADLVRANTRTPPVPPKTQKPAAGRHSKRVEHRALTGGIVTDEEIEVWIEAESPVLKAVEIVDREIVNPD
jgi:hypothetical protein